LSKTTIAFGIAFMVLGILSPLAQLVLIWPMPSFERLADDAGSEWVNRSVFRGDGSFVVIDRTLNSRLRGSAVESLDSGAPRGRSHPEISSGFGPEVVIDGIVRFPGGDSYNPFWSFYPEYVPVELAIIDERENERVYKWVCVVPRWTLQSAYRIDVITDSTGSDGEFITSLAVPMHYQGPRPVTYHFGHIDGIGIRLVLQGSKVATNNDWWTPIYEVAAGVEESDNQ